MAGETEKLFILLVREKFQYASVQFVYKLRKRMFFAIMFGFEFEFVD